MSNDIYCCWEVPIKILCIAQGSRIKNTDNILFSNSLMRLQEIFVTASHFFNSQSESLIFFNYLKNHVGTISETSDMCKC